MEFSSLILPTTVLETYQLIGDILGNILDPLNTDAFLKLGASAVLEAGRTTETTVWFRSTALLMALIRLGLGITLVAIPSAIYYPYQIITKEVAPRIQAMQSVVNRIGLTNEGVLFDKLASFVITVPYILTAGISVLTISAGILILPMVPVFLTFPIGPLVVGVTYTAAGLGGMYFYVLVYYFRKNWQTLFADTWDILYNEVSDQIGYLYNDVSQNLQCAFTTSCRDDFLKTNRSYYVRMFFYSALAAQIVFSLNYDIIIAYATSRKGQEEVDFSVAIMDFGMQWYILVITVFPILINFLFLAISGVYALSSVLSQLQSDTFDNNHLTQGLEIMIGAVIALAFQIPQFVEAYFYSAFLEAYLGP